ncbi:acyltransferase domain-containing protein [Streptomyces sp. CS090A]|uniref:acyltransferase domain-containing protein n=1 Tax=Streptomyces sp. CS090A TaxID=2162710 RepID=UPI001EF6E54A|nr:acyltransferase domain-containing protein [Streptomyces sp. CS090A]
MSGASGDGAHAPGGSPVSAGADTAADRRATPGDGVPRHGDPAAGRRWLDLLRDQPAAPVPDPVLPSSAELARRLNLLAVPGQDRKPVYEGLTAAAEDPAAREALVRCHQRLFADGPESPTTPPAWPDAPAGLGEAGRYFYVHLLVLALPAAMERQRLLGIPDDVVAATFADLGAKLRSYRLAYGTGGFDRQRWMVRHFRGTLHRLGRLQFERGILDAEGCGGDAEAAGGPAHGDPVLQVHIPEDGPLSRAGCDASFAAAGPFHDRHFPETRFRHATCSSWLLDRQWADHLPESSNILAFQRRFQPFGAVPVGDDDVLEFVFHVPPGRADLDRLPQETTLHRAAVGHLRAGGHWRMTHGWTSVPGRGTGRGA